MREVVLAVCVLSVGVLTFAQQAKDPVAEFRKKAEKEIAERNYRELRDASAELATLARVLSEEVDKSSVHVISAKIFEKLEQIEKVTKRVKQKARGPLLRTEEFPPEGSAAREE